LIRKLLNLVCEHGHRAYSPTPDSFVGKPCMECEAPQRLLADDAPLAPVVPLRAPTHRPRAASAEDRLLAAIRSPHDADTDQWANVAWIPMREEAVA
jgi:hypothetical protein